MSQIALDSSWIDEPVSDIQIDIYMNEPDPMEIVGVSEDV